ncbi:DUF6266 family protein [Pedobacter duraquae]|uniref:Uncharacterized protein n=1 Tax=Pedobacter duraquae TaxID=425511 RepID=A0A4R6IG63_9SPHI|nr:DUF6266 family protein [Pedobacter duraquae]TDO20806.1 hypothetical protein CLV32_3440 [Pedobacter duraquae]
MGIAKNGIHGPVSGKVGQVVWYESNGQNLARGIGSRTAARTPNEIQSSNRQSVLIKFFVKIKPFITKGFSGAAAGTTRNFHNLAVSYNRLNAIHPDKSKTDILYDKVRLAQGNLPTPQNPSVTKNAEGLEFKWEFEGLANDRRNDRTMLLAYFPAKDLFVYDTSGARRKTLSDELAINELYINDTMHVYMAFCATDETLDVSNSIYLGQIN